MGANAQTSVPKFTAAQVLTASQQNLSAATGVPVFATTVTRDAAFGGSNKALAEGQLCYIEASDVVQYYTGAAWATVGPAAAAASGLTCVKAETAFSAVANFTADNVFTSSYTNYFLTLRYTSSASAPLMQFAVGGVAAATNYNYQLISADSTTVAASRSTAQTSALIAGDSGGDFKSFAYVNISGPQLAEPTDYISKSLRNSGAYTSPIILDIAGNHSTATAYDGIKVLVSSGTMTGTYAIYGYSKTV